jgi:predicted ATP-grasp superfamily ATP-dependent carboligase
MEELTGQVDISHLQDQVERLQATRTRITQLQAQEKELIAQIRAGMGSHQTGVVGGIQAVVLSQRQNTHIDRALLKQNISEELFARVTKITPYIAMRVLIDKRRAA